MKSELKIKGFVMIVEGDPAACRAAMQGAVGVIASLFDQPPVEAPAAIEAPKPGRKKKPKSSTDGAAQ